MKGLEEQIQTRSYYTQLTEQSLIDFMNSLERDLMFGTRGDYPKFKKSMNFTIRRQDMRGICFSHNIYSILDMLKSEDQETVDLAITVVENSTRYLGKSLRSFYNNEVNVREIGMRWAYQNNTVTEWGIPIQVLDKIKIYYENHISKKKKI